MKTHDKANALLKSIDSSLRSISRGMSYAHWQTIREQLKELQAIAHALDMIDAEIESQNRN